MGQRTEGENTSAEQGNGGTAEQIVCIASGPSLTQEDVDRCFGQRVIVVNDNWKKAPWAEVLYACDWAWWREYLPAVRRGFGGRLVSQRGGNEPIQSDFCRKHGIEQYPLVKKKGLGKDHIRAGGNGGHQALNLAYLLGGRRIILLGYDMQKTGGKFHWFGDHPRTLRNPSAINKWARNFNHIANDMKREGVEVINATRETALDCFPRMPIDEALKGS